MSLKKIILLAVGCFVASAALCAEESPNERLLSPAARVKIEETRFQLKAEAEKNGRLPTTGFKAEHRSELQSKGFYDAYIFTLMPEAMHVAIDISIFNDIIRLEDGSEWVVASADQFEVSNWWVGDQLYITQSNLCCGPYSYMIINENRGTVIYANRLSKPTSWLYTKQITFIDRFADRILLNDGTCWNVAWVDDTTLARWMPGDTIIIGINSGYDSLTNPFILVNVGIDIFNVGADEYVGAQLSY